MSPVSHLRINTGITPESHRGQYTTGSRRCAPRAV